MDMPEHKTLMQTDVQYQIEYTRLLFMHGDLFLNIYRALHLRKDTNFRIPPRYKDVTMEVVAFYNQYFKGQKNEQKI